MAACIPLPAYCAGPHPLSSGHSNGQDVQRS
jgi:hypothetical protein